MFARGISETGSIPTVKGLLSSALGIGQKPLCIMHMIQKAKRQECETGKEELF